MGDLTIDRKPLKHLDELYPGYRFMELDNKVNGQRTIVGTRQTISGQPLYQELVVEGDEMLEAKAALIVDALDKQAEKARWRKEGLVVGYYRPHQWQKLKADEREAGEVL